MPDKDTPDHIHARILRQRLVGTVLASIIVLSIIPARIFHVEDSFTSLNERVRQMHGVFMTASLALSVVIASAAYIVRRRSYTGLPERLGHGTIISYALGLSVTVSGFMLMMMTHNANRYIPFALISAAAIYLVRPSTEHWRRGRQQYEKESASTAWVRREGFVAWVIGGVIAAPGAVLALIGLMHGGPAWLFAPALMMLVPGVLALTYTRTTVVDGAREEIGIRTSVAGLRRDQLYRTDEFEFAYLMTRMSSGRSSAGPRYLVRISGPGGMLVLYSSTIEQEAREVLQRISALTGIPITDAPEGSPDKGRMIAMLLMIIIAPLALALLYLILR